MVAKLGSDDLVSRLCGRSVVGEEAGKTDVSKMRKLFDGNSIIEEVAIAG